MKSNQLLILIFVFLISITSACTSRKEKQIELFKKYRSAINLITGEFIKKDLNGGGGALKNILPLLKELNFEFEQCNKSKSKVICISEIDLQKADSLIIYPPIELLSIKKSVIIEKTYNGGPRFDISKTSKVKVDGTDVEHYLSDTMKNIALKKKYKKSKPKKWKLIIAFLQDEAGDTGDFPYYTSEIETGCKKTKTHFKWANLKKSKISITKDNIYVDMTPYIKKYNNGWLLLENGKKPIYLFYDPGNVYEAIKFCKN